MDEIIKSIETALSDSQRQALEALIGDAESKGYTMNETPAPTGEKLFSVPTRPTDPYQYNTAVAAAMADLTALYSALDAVSLTSSSLDYVNKRELDQVQAEVEKLEGLLATIASTAASGAAYTHLLRQDFTADAGDPLFIPDELPRLTIDRETNSLTRPVALDVSRITSIDKNAMCKVEVESMIGTTTEARHPISEAIDGKVSTFWRETVLANSPIVANKSLVPWLSGTRYTSGAALRLRFTFEALTPISEIAIKPLADYPMDILDVAWSTDTIAPKAIGGAVNVGGDFSTWPGTWTYTSTGTVTATNPAEGQDNTKCLKLAFDGSVLSRGYITKTIPELKPGGVYVITFRAKSSSGTGFASLELTSNSGSSVLARHTPSLTKEWKLYSYVVTLDQSMTDSAKLKVTFYDSDTVWFDDLQINTSAVTIAPNAVANSSGAVVIPLSRDYGRPVMARTVWITLAQSNYNLRHYSVPRWAIDASNLWAQTMGDATALEDWASVSSPWRNRDDLLPIGVSASSPLARAAHKLGGKIKSLLASLMRLSEETDETIDVAKYEYTFGAWEIDLRYKDYGPRGYWVSKPLNVRGEIRQMTIVPEMGAIESDKVRIFVLPHSNSAVDPASAVELASSYNIYFKPTTESGIISSGVDASTSAVIPVTPKHISPADELPYDGTDRYKVVRLRHQPYFNAERAAQIHRTVTSGEVNQQNHYDPNAVSIAYVDTSIEAPTIRTATGYNPVKVTLNISGRIVPPDTLGRSLYTRFKVYRDDHLELVTDGTTITETRQTATGSGTTASEQNTTAIKVYRTSRAIAHTGGTPRVALYWHEKNTPDSEDILIDPNKYTAYWSNTGALSQSGAYSDTVQVTVDAKYATSDYQLVAYYRTEVPAGVMVHDPIEVEDKDYSYVPSDGGAPLIGLTDLALQSYPVTRNMTDYLTGKTPKLTPYNPDRASKNYYPVYEYYVDRAGNLVFADDLFKYGDNPAIITVEYDTLDINPRILICFDDPEIGTSTCSSPMVFGYSTLLNARV